MILTIFCLNLFGAEYSLGNKKISLDTQTIENYTYVNSKDLAKFALTEKVEGNVLTLVNKELSMEFSGKNVKINKQNYTLSNGLMKKDNKTYVDLSFIMEVLNYDLNGNKISKANEYNFPIKEEKYNVTKVAKKIVSLAPGVTEKLYDIGMFDSIVGRTDYCAYPVEVADIPSIGTMFSPNVEKIIELKPDLVIAETHFNEKVLNKLREAGIEVFATSSANNFDDMFRFIKKLGFITDKTYEARGLVASLKNKVDRTKFVLKDVSNKPSVYYAVGAGKGDYTAGRDTFIAELIRTVGATNVGDVITGWTFSLEKLIETNPKMIFGPSYSINTMTSSDAYKGLSAIKNKSYFIVDENIFNLSGPRLINDGIKVLVGKLYPNKVKALGF